ncbi:MAG: 30S ribosomal protein S3 [Desulfurococcales archaeon]|nr:30S ribosomal protein S3 [Desulfurococcales archaeon]
MTKVKRYFLNQALMRAKIDEYMTQNFYEAGYSGIQVVESGLGTRIHIFAERPALIIGRRGSTIRRLQELFSTVFGFENPQITVSQPDNPELDARIQAFRIARFIERGYHFRRVAFTALRRIISSGAVGVEITISGKLTSERARFEKFRAGKVYKSGQIVDELVDRAVAHAKLPKGIIGVEVIIVKPGAPADYVRVKEEDEVREVIEALREEKEEAEVSMPDELKEMLEEVEESG